uniref:Uncharacterized protein n=1 Tax=Arundo donax TaxID=35708 RepID=A0A0A8ZKJ2_ARUDO
MSVSLIMNLSTSAKFVGQVSVTFEGNAKII